MILWDAPGLGKSRPFLPDYTLDELVCWLKGILETEDIKEALLVGHAIGSYEAQVFAARFPDRVQGLVSVSAGPLRKGAVSRKELLAVRLLKPVCRFFPLKKLSGFLSRRMSATEEGQEAVKKTLSAYGTNRKEFADAASHYGKLLKIAFDSEKTYPLSCKCIICGAKDRAGSALTDSGIWSREDGHPLWIIPKAGHNVPVDQADA